MYQELIKAVEQRKYFEGQLDTKKREFAESIAIEVATVQDLKDLEDKLREQVLLEMKQKNKESEIVGDNSINLVQKVTRKIQDPQKLLNDMFSNQQKIEKFVGESIEKFTNKYFKQEYKVEDKDKVMEMVNTFQSVEGKLLDGVIDQCIEYLMVK